jgi:cytochrome c2
MMKRAITAFLFIFSLSFSAHVIAQDGQALFKANCASCHKPNKDATGPALQGWKDRQPEGWIYKWVAGPAKMIASGDAYTKDLYSKWKQNGVMSAFANLKKEEVDAIMKYVDDYKDPIPTKGPDGDVKGSDNSLMYGILLLILALVTFVLVQVNSNLKKLTDDKDGVRRGESVPFYKNKSYIMIGVLVAFAALGYAFINKSINLGRSKDYQPEQPIYYSHKVHAGTNQITCLYCHGGAQDSKHANIPSVNTCMNCHKSINEYQGQDKLVREDGTAVNGTEEIQKLYEYSGWNPNTKSYNPDNNGDGVPDGAKPIEWVRIHNLPDHVYFNHSQHVKVGKQNCQTCHGNIQEMGEVYQYSDLSMGWCVNCHRESKVDFAKEGGNQYYNGIFKNYSNMMVDSVLDKDGEKVVNPHKLDSVTVEMIGGIECQKCHY